MPELMDRPDLPAGARWTALGGFLIEIGGLAVPAQLGAAAPADLGMATLAQLLLGLAVAGAGASAFVVPWTRVPRAIGMIGGGISLLLAAWELSWGAPTALAAMLGGGIALLVGLRWPLEAGHVPRGPAGSLRPRP